MLVGKKEIIGSKIQNYLKFDSKTETDKDFRKLLLQDKQRSLITLTNKNDSLILADVKVVDDRDNNIYFLICGNISDLMRAEEKFYKTFEINSNLMSITTIEEGLFVDVNEAFLATLGYDKDEVIGKNVTELSIYGFPKQRKTIVTELKKEGFIKSFEISVKTKTGKFLEGLYTAELIFFQDRKYILATITDITEKKLTSAKYKSYIQNAPDGVFLINNRGDYLEVNKAGLRLTGYSESEILKLNMSKLLLVDNNKQGIKSFAEFLVSGKIEKEFVLRKKNGELIDILLTAVKLNPERYIGFVKDITERKRVEKSLVESESRFHSMFMEHDSIMLLINAESGEIVDVNKYAEKFYGYKRPQFLKMKIEDINTAPAEEACNMRTKATSRKLNSFVVQHKLSNGELRMVEHHSSPINMDNRTMLFSIIYDVTEKYKADELIKEQKLKLIEAKNLLDSVIDNIPFKIWFKDKDGKYLMANRLFGDYHKLNQKEFIGKTDYDIIDKEWADKFVNADKTAMESKMPVTIEETIIENNESHWYETIKNAFFDERGVVIGTIGISREVTYRKKTEVELKSLVEQLKISKIEMEELNAEKDKFFSIIAHDLRSPLLGFLAFTGMLSETIFDLTMREMQEYSRKLQSSAAILYRLLENLLEWSRIKRGFVNFFPSNESLSEIVKSNIDILSQTASLKDITIENKIIPDMEIFGDPNMLNTVFRNVLSNAVKYTPRGGKITVSAKKENNITSISIKDTGIGIPADKIDNLFKISEKVLRKGTEGEESTGLGLLLVKEYVDKHNGKILVESKEGEGTTFKFTVNLNSETDD
jgi:PAS domain S-box-containing protein